MYLKNDLALLDQEQRCRAALKMIDVPPEIIWQFRGPLLFQLAHLCCVIDQPMHWRDALRWMHDHRGEILAHAQQVMKAKHENLTTSTEANRTPDGVDVGPARQG